MAEKDMICNEDLPLQVELSRSAVRYPGDEIIVVCLPSEMIILLPVVTKFRGKSNFIYGITKEICTVVVIS